MILPFSDRGLFRTTTISLTPLSLPPPFAPTASIHFRRHCTIRFYSRWDRIFLDPTQIESISSQVPPNHITTKLCKRIATVQPDSTPNPHRAAKLTSNPWKSHRAVAARIRRKKNPATSSGISPRNRLVRSGANTATAIRNREAKWRSNHTRRWHV